MNLRHTQAIKGVADSVNSKKCTWQQLRSNGKLSLFSNAPSKFLDSSQRLQPFLFLSLPALCPWPSQAHRRKWEGSGICCLSPLCRYSSGCSSSVLQACSLPTSGERWNFRTCQSKSKKKYNNLLQLEWENFMTWAATNFLQEFRSFRMSTAEGVSIGSDKRILSLDFAAS